MNSSYGDSNDAAHGGYGEQPYDPYGYGSYDPYEGPPPGRPSVGRASAGRPGNGSPYAGTPRAGNGYRDGGGYDEYDGYGASGNPGYGGGSPYGGDSGYDGSGFEGGSGYPGSGNGGYGGTATGRATVRPRPLVDGDPEYGGPDYGGPDYGGPDYGRPGSPGGPRGPRGPRRWGGSGSRGPKLKRAKRRRLIVSAIAGFIMLSGVVVVVGAYEFDTVALPDTLPTPSQSTVIYYSDGTTAMARLGDQTRTIIPDSQIPLDMKHAIVAAEDNTFYTNSGVDLKGVIRAAWNNLTGGAQQGGSTITQQYARNVLNLEGATYARKIREAILAMKLSQRYKKDQILNFYLNIVYFGRGAYGVEAAAQAYFKKDASALTKAECMALAELVKDPAGSDGYDPAINLPSAQSRFGYVNDQMLKLNFETQADHDGAKYPTNWIKPNPGQENGQFGLDTATGFIVHHVMDELSHLTKADGTQEFPDLQNGGYKIITTIDKNLEQDAINAASPVVKGSVLDGQPKNLISALVAVQPGTGRVLAYYGGDNGAGLDRAGIYNDPVLAPATDGSDGWTGENHQAGSTFKVVTMAAALKAHYSIDSYWYGPAARYFPDQARCPTPLTPAAKAAGCTQPGVGAVTTGSDKCPDNSLPIPNVCPMWEGLVRSTNTMYFAIDDAIGTPNVIDMAKALGVHWMWDNDHKRIDLTATTGAKLEGRITAEVSYGQFGVTVIDQADVAATVASRGVQAQTHFVSKVLKGSQTVLQERIRQNNLNSFGLTPEMLDDETWAMGQVNHGAIHGAKNQLAGLWADDGAGKTGTWELCSTCSNSSYNGNAWYTGFTPTLAATVWLGADPSVKVPGIPDGAIMYKAPGVSKLQNVNGFDIPGSIWKRFMDAALKGAKPVAFHSRKDVGDPSRGDPTLGPNYSPVPSLSPSPTDTGQPTGGPGGGSCGPLPIFCPPPSSSGGGHGGTGGGPSPRRSH